MKSGGLYNIIKIGDDYTDERKEMAKCLKRRLIS